MFRFATTVTDPAGEPIPGVAVEILNLDGVPLAEATTDQHGEVETDAPVPRNGAVAIQYATGNLLEIVAVPEEVAVGDSVNVPVKIDTEMGTLEVGEILVTKAESESSSHSATGSSAPTSQQTGGDSSSGGSSEPSKTTKPSKPAKKPAEESGSGEASTGGEGGNGAEEGSPGALQSRFAGWVYGPSGDAKSSETVAVEATLVSGETESVVVFTDSSGRYDITVSGEVTSYQITVGATTHEVHSLNMVDGFIVDLFQYTVGASGTTERVDERQDRPEGGSDASSASSGESSSGSTPESEPLEEGVEGPEGVGLVGETGSSGGESTESVPQEETEAPQSNPSKAPGKASSASKVR